jgi:hypothetical protein
VRTPLALFGLAVVVRAILFVLHPDAAYPDSYYYVDVARALQAGHGFSIDFIWSFVDVGGRIPANPILPIPSNAHWMPLASLIQLPTMWLLGPTPLASMLPFITAGSLAAPLTWLVAREAGADERVALAAAAAVAIPGAVAIYMAQPDNMALYQPLGTAALWLAARGLRGHGPSYAGAGLMVGLATLSRNDGVLLGAAVGIPFLWDRWRSWRSRGSRLPTVPWRYALACIGLFLVITAPWYLRQLEVFGSISPSSSSGRILLIRTYEEMNSVTSDTSLAGFLGQGPIALLSSRILGLVSAVQVFGVIAIPIVVAPFVAIGCWARRRSPEFGPFLLYAAILFAAAGLVFAVHVPYGTFLHSAVALVPLALIAGFEGLVIAARWVAPRRRGWTVDGAARLFLVTGVAAVVVNTVAFAAIALPGWNVERDRRIEAGRALDSAGATPVDRLMSADPAGFEYFTGRGGVVTPNDSLDVIREVAADYGIRWLVLERDHIVAPLEAVIEGLVRPSWLGQPVYTIAWTGKATGDAAADAAPALAIYPVCTTAGDTRCGGSADGQKPGGLSPVGFRPGSQP